MAWWEVLDTPYIRETEGVLVLAGAVTLVLLVIAFGCALLWQQWKDAKRRAPKARG